MIAMTAKTFHIGDILSVTTGALVSPSHIGGVYDILGHMTGEDLFTHQLPRATDECAPELRRQHPDLAAVRPPDEFRDEAHVWQWLAEQVDRFGAYRDVTPLRPEDHTRIDPIAELRMLRPDAPIIAVETE